MQDHEYESLFFIHVQLKSDIHVMYGEYVSCSLMLYIT